MKLKAYLNAGLLGARFGVECFPQRFALARKSEAEQRAAARLRASFAGEALGQTNEALRCSGFSQPKSNPLRGRFAAQRPIMTLDQGINHRPVPFALGFLRLDEVPHGEELEGLRVFVTD